MVKYWAVKRWAKMLLTIGLAVILTACGSNLPGQSVVTRAIAMQVVQVQAEIAQQLKLKAPTMQDVGVERLQIEQQTDVTIDQEPGYHLTGRYDLRLQQSDHRAMQADDGFDLYLQRHTEGVGKAQKQGWRLAEPIDGGWVLRAIELK